MYGQTPPAERGGGGRNHLDLMAQSLEAVHESMQCKLHSTPDVRAERVGGRRDGQDPQAGTFVDVSGGGSVRGRCGKPRPRVPTGAPPNGGGAGHHPTARPRHAGGRAREDEQPLPAGRPVPKRKAAISKWRSTPVLQQVAIRARRSGPASGGRGSGLGATAAVTRRRARCSGRRAWRWCHRRASLQRGAADGRRHRWPLEAGGKEQRCAHRTSAAPSPPQPQLPRWGGAGLHPPSPHRASDSGRRRHPRRPHSFSPLLNPRP